MTAGFVATLVLSGLMLLNSRLGVLPQINIIDWLTSLGTLSVPSAWMDHVIVGTVVWGLLFAGFDAIATRPAAWIKGAIFAVFAWLAMMVTFMPLAGAGFFGAKIDNTALLGLLALHLAYGLVLGTTYGLLGVWLPVKAPEMVAEEAGVMAGPDGFTMNSADINDHLPTSNPSGRTLLVILGCAVGSFALLVLVMELRSRFGF
jgi:hypothetical protein